MLPKSEEADTTSTTTTTMKKLDFEDPKVHKARMLVIFFFISLMFNSTLIGAYFHRDTSLDALLAFWFALLFVAENSVVAYRRLHQGERPELKPLFVWLLPSYVVAAIAAWFGSSFVHVILVVFMFCAALASRLFLDFVPHMIKQDQAAAAATTYACCDNNSSKCDGVQVAEHVV